MHPVLFVNLEPGALFPLGILEWRLRNAICETLYQSEGHWWLLLFFFCLKIFFPRRLMWFTVSVSFEAFPRFLFQVPSLCLALTLVLIVWTPASVSALRRLQCFTLWTHYPPECDPREAGPASSFCSVHSGAGWWVIT